MTGIRVLILAAGSSQRLRPLTDEIPKTLIPLNGKTILNHIVACCLKCGLTRISLVTGHGHEKLQDECNHIRAVRPELEFSYIHCPAYASMGNVCSLYVARDVFLEPFVLINSDLVFAHEILNNLLASPKANAIVIDDHKQLGSEEMKVTVRNGVVTSISKTLNPVTSDGEYIGMLKIHPAIAKCLETSLYRLVESAPDKYYEDALQQLMSEGVGFHKVSTGGAPCMEIDTFDDLALARASAQLWV